MVKFMAQEIEKKKLLKENREIYALDSLSHYYDSFDLFVKDVLERGKLIHQGYLPIQVGLELADLLGMDRAGFTYLEARLRNIDANYYFTVKSEGDLARFELEKEIDSKLFEQYWPRTKGNRVSKIRLTIPYHKYKAEIDVYTDRDLVVAEVEVPTIENTESLISLGKDITNDKKYKNKNLAK